MKEIEAQMKLMGKEGFQIANQQAEDAAEDAELEERCRTEAETNGGDHQPYHRQHRAP